MSKMSDHLENKLIDHIFRSATFAQPAAIWMALGTAAADNSFTELSGGGYARYGITRADSWWYSTQRTLSGPSMGTSGATSNSNVLSFPQASANWNAGADITHFALYDAVSGGNLLFHNPLAWPVRVYQGDTFRFPVDGLWVTLA